MSSMDIEQLGNSNENRKAGRLVASVIDLTSSADESDDDDHWEDARQSPSSPQGPDVKPNVEQLAKFGEARRRGVARNMPMHDRRPERQEHLDLMEFGAANPHPDQNGVNAFELPGLGLQQPAQAPQRPVRIDLEDDLWENYFINDEGDLEAAFQEVAHPLALDFQPPPQPQAQMAAIAVPPADHDLPIQIANPEAAHESKDACLAMLSVVFPGICPDHVSRLYEKIAQTSNQLITHILDQIDKGIEYPKAKDKQKSLKRKRVLDEDEETAKKYGAVDRVVSDRLGGIRPYIRSILQQEFSVTPVVFIDATLIQNNFRLFSAYRVLEEAHRTYDSIPPPYNKIKNPRKMDRMLKEAAVESTLSKHDADGEKIEVLKELQAARRMRRKGDLQREAERLKELEEEENVRKAEAEGTMAECGCCCCDYPLNRMVHCDSEEMHWFCRNCARTTAEVEIGKSKYDLRCMSTEKCEAGFAMDQRIQFLDDKTRIALERNEQEANLRLAGIENLASCPFCPFAAEYPPVEIDREFRCQAEDCERVSCRLCKLESHIPKSCEEFAKENGLSIRRQIEEAMSAALIRKCNKCNTPFVKEEGCNKMTCTRNGCYNIQCYVCSKSCSYDHFNDASRGGKVGNCPLFESVEQRHEDEVKKAEQEALAKVLADHPEFTAEDLKVKMSENVQKDDEKRKAMDPRARQDAMIAAAHNGPRIFQGLPLPPDGVWQWAAGQLPAPPLRLPMVPRMGQEGLVPIRQRLGRIPRPVPAMRELPQGPELERALGNQPQAHALVPPANELGGDPVRPAAPIRAQRGVVRFGDAGLAAPPVLPAPLRHFANQAPNNAHFGVFAADFDDVMDDGALMAGGLYDYMIDFQEDIDGGDGDDFFF